MNIKQSTLAAAVTAALALGVSQQAAAYVYAGASNPISNVVIVFTAGTVVDSFSFDVASTAKLGSTAQVASGDSCATANLGGPVCSAVSPVLTSGAANGTGSVPLRADNDYSLAGPVAAGTYANSNSAIVTAQLTQGVPSSIEAVAEARIEGTGNGTADTDVQSNTNVTMSFTTPNTGSFSLSFNANPYVETALNTANLLAASGGANINVTATLQSLDETVRISFTPDSTGSYTCISPANVVTCSTLDPYTLQQSQNVLGNPSDSIFNPGVGTFQLSALNMPALSYRLYLTAGAGVNVRQAVPEPGVLALMGIGLMGLGLSARRKKIV